MPRNYREALEREIAKKEALFDEAMENLWLDSTVPRGVFRSIGEARAESCSVLDTLRRRAHLTRRDIELELDCLQSAYQRSKNRTSSKDPDGFGTGVYVDAIQVLKAVLAEDGTGET